MSEDSKSNEMVERIKAMASMYQALANAQSEFTAVKMNKSAIVRGNKEYKYGDLQAIIEATRPALNKNGFFISFVTETDYTESPIVSATPVLFHESGYEVKGNTIWISSGDRSPHAIGSAITYAKRYALSSMLCVAAEDDDDGHVAMEGQGQGDSQNSGKGAQQSPKNQSPPVAANRQSRRPATVPPNQSSTNGKLEQFVDGKLNQRFQTANGLLSIKEIKALSDALDKAEINGQDLGDYLNKTIYKETPIRSRYDIKKVDFDAIMLLLEKNPKNVFAAAISDKEDSPPWEGDHGFITQDQVNALKLAVESANIPVKQFKKWLSDYTFALHQARVDKPEQLWPAWYADIMKRIEDDAAMIINHGA